jgi:hypothetical protein
VRLRKKNRSEYDDDDDRSFAVALRLELAAKRFQAISEELEEQLEAKDHEDGKKEEGP